MLAQAQGEAENGERQVRAYAAKSAEAALEHVRSAELIAEGQQAQISSNAAILDKWGKELEAVQKRLLRQQ